MAKNEFLPIVKRDVLTINSLEFVLWFVQLDHQTIRMDSQVDSIQMGLINEGSGLLFDGNK